MKSHKTKTNPIFITQIVSFYLQNLPLFGCKADPCNFCRSRRHLASNFLNDKAVDWVSMNLSYVATAEAFDQFLSQQVGWHSTLSQSCEDIRSSSSYLVLWCSDVNVSIWCIYLLIFIYDTMKWDCFSVDIALVFTSIHLVSCSSMPRQSATPLAAIGESCKVGSIGAAAERKLSGVRNRCSIWWQRVEVPCQSEKALSKEQTTDYCTCYAHASFCWCSVTSLCTKSKVGDVHAAMDRRWREVINCLHFWLIILLYCLHSCWTARKSPNLAAKEGLKTLWFDGGREGAVCSQGWILCKDGGAPTEKIGWFLHRQGTLQSVWNICCNQIYT